MQRITANVRAMLGEDSFRASGYREIAGAIQGWISVGRLQPGDRLPPEMELSRQFDVTRLTVRRALDVLETRSLIHRMRRRGTFVSDGALLPPVVSPLSQSLRQIFQITGFSIAFLGWARVRADQATKTALKIEREPHVYEFRFVRSNKSGPLGYFVYRLPEWVAKQLGPIQENENFKLRTALSAIGFESKRIMQMISAQMTDSSVSKVLQLQDGEAVLRFRATHFDAKDRPFIYATSYFQSEDFEYGIEFVDDIKIKNLRDS